MLQLVESGDFRCRHGATLQDQRPARVLRKLVIVGRVYGTEIAFGSDVQANRLGNIPAKQYLESVRTRLLVQVIDAVFREIDVVTDQQMAQIVEQRRDHQAVAEATFCR